MMRSPGPICAHSSPQKRRWRPSGLSSASPAPSVIASVAGARRPGAAGRSISEGPSSANLSRGGEPIELRRKHRPERPVKLVVLLDASGSMEVYSRYFINFMRGLIGGRLYADAFLFHTRLVHVADALRERDRSVGMTRLSLMADGFGGGT